MWQKVAEFKGAKYFRKALYIYSPFGEYSGPLTFSTSAYTQYPIMTKQKLVFRNVCKLIENKTTEITHLHKYSDPLLSTLLSVGYDATSVAYLYLGSFSHFSLQILSNSVRLGEERCCTAIFSSLQRCLIELKSQLSLGHLRTFRDLSRSHSCVVPSALEQVFIKDLSVLCSVHLYLDHD